MRARFSCRQELHRVLVAMAAEDAQGIEEEAP